MKHAFRKLYIIFIYAFCIMGQANALNERIVHDPNTGLALFGYDPISYFVNIVPKIGTSKNELYLDGVSWRFYSEGNKRVFEKSPESYSPQFGGYDPIALSHNKISIPDPRFYVIYKDKLFLFASAASRATFSVEPDYYYIEAKNNWPKIKLNLPTH